MVLLWFTCKMMVAIIAQKKLFHIVLFGNALLISSNANRTPPIGEPKATATPAALEAVSISLISAIISENTRQSMMYSVTFASPEFLKAPRYYISDTAGHMHRWTLFSDRQI